MTDAKLIQTARRLVRPFALARPDFSAATVGCALLSRQGNVYTGVCFDVACGIGFCAEHAAVAEMLKHGETAIATIVASHESAVLSPCGRCRELLVQVDTANFDTRVLLSADKAVPLRELLPRHWMREETA